MQIDDTVLLRKRTCAVVMSQSGRARSPNEPVPSVGEQTFHLWVLHPALLTTFTEAEVSVRKL